MTAVFFGRHSPVRRDGGTQKSNSPLEPSIQPSINSELSPKQGKLIRLWIVLVSSKQALDVVTMILHESIFQMRITLS